MRTNKNLTMDQDAWQEGFRAAEEGKAGCPYPARKRAKEGRCEGRKPYGFYEGESEALNRIKALRAESKGFDRIAAKLNEERVPTRTGRPWHGVVINRILTGKR